MACGTLCKASSFTLFNRANQTEIMRLKSELTSAHERFLSEQVRRACMNTHALCGPRGSYSPNAPQKARQAVYSELEATRASAASLRSSQLRSHALVPSVPAPSARVFELEQQIRVLRSQLATATSEAERARDTNSAASVAAMQLQAVSGRKQACHLHNVERTVTNVCVAPAVCVRRRSGGLSLSWKACERRCRSKQIPFRCVDPPRAVAASTLTAAMNLQRLESQCGELRGQASRMTLQLNLLREQHSKLVAEVCLLAFSPACGCLVV